MAGQLKITPDGRLAKYRRGPSAPDAPNRSYRVGPTVGTTHAASALATVWQLPRMGSVEMLFTNPANILTSVTSCHHQPRHRRVASRPGVATVAGYRSDHHKISAHQMITASGFVRSGTKYSRNLEYRNRSYQLRRAWRPLPRPQVALTQELEKKDQDCRDERPTAPCLPTRFKQFTLEGLRRIWRVPLWSLPRSDA